MEELLQELDPLDKIEDDEDEDDDDDDDDDEELEQELGQPELLELQPLELTHGQLDDELEELEEELLLLLLLLETSPQM